LENECLPNFRNCRSIPCCPAIRKSLLAGKSAPVPPARLGLCAGEILVIEPRRLAARLAPGRVERSGVSRSLMAEKRSSPIPDPVAAYDRIAPAFARLAQRRKAYLDRVDQLVISQIPAGRRSLLDVGAGDGTRARRIARAGGLRELVLLEPSAGMRSNWPAQDQARTMRAEDLHQEQGRFDVITCLWNVLGHIAPAAKRVEVLRQFARLVAPEGRIFLDVTHRYNARHFGAVRTALRFLRDRVSPGGDVVVAWGAGGAEVRTTGHVFTHNEVRSLSRQAGLIIEKRFVVDYGTGELRRRSFEGNLLYVLRRADEPSKAAAAGAV
jgi:2-polyprenyl-3-methyl-5-hydroxy-6-metoxy-1,4-benzoquinol methylase